MKLFFKLMQQSRLQHINKIFFGKYLLTTNTVVSGLLMLAGDSVQQFIEMGKITDETIEKSFDWERNRKMGIVGLVMGPLHHYYYTYIDRVLPKRTMKTVFTKIACDQMIMSPICILLFFYGNNFLDNRDLKYTIQEVKEKFVTVYTTDWCVWPPVQFINFYFLSPSYRVLYINVATTLYNVFLSYMKFEFQTKDVNFIIHQ